MARSHGRYDVTLCHCKKTIQKDNWEYPLEAWLEFGQGPLFRISFALMVLGLLRAFGLSLFGMIEALRRAGDKVVPWGDLWKKSFSWLVPVTRVWNRRPVYSTISYLWHIGLILVPLFLAAHVRLFWVESVGVTWWPVLEQRWADLLTGTTVLLGIMLFLGRVLHRDSRYISRFQDLFWVPLLTVVFLTGGLCANIPMSAGGYQASMLIHTYGANLVMIMIPFTKVAHCILLPLSQFVSGVGWKFPKGAGAKINATLGKGGSPV